MNKGLIKSLIVVWSIIAVLLIGILVYGISRGISGGDFFTLFDVVSDSDLKVQKDQKVSIDGTQKINVDFSSSEINVQYTDDSQFRAVFRTTKGSKNIKDFSVNKDGDTISVSDGEFHHFVFFGFGCDRRAVDVYIPRSYDKDIYINDTSGTIRFASNMKFNNFSCKQTSGNIHLEDGITADDFRVEETSGNVRLGDINSNSYYVKSTSGSININKISGSGSISTTSGNIRAAYSDIKDSAEIHATSGNIRLSVPRNLSIDFNGRVTSGNIHTDFDVNYMSKWGKEVQAKVGDGPYKKLDVSLTSGNISIDRE